MDPHGPRPGRSACPSLRRPVRRHRPDLLAAFSSGSRLDAARGGFFQDGRGLDADTGGRWGATLGDRYCVWRPGLGQTATGALVYVAGDRLSAATLAGLLRRAGAVRAMELDINPQWTGSVDHPAEEDLLPDVQRSPTRYDTTSSRDFVAVLARTP